MSLTEELDSMLDLVEEVLGDKVKEEEGAPLNETIAKILEVIPPEKIPTSFLEIYEKSKSSPFDRGLKVSFYYEYVEIFENMIKDGGISVDINGHYKNGTYITNPSYGTPKSLEGFIICEIAPMLCTYKFKDCDIVGLTKLIFNPDQNSDEWVTFYKGNCLKQCPDCSENIVLETNGSVIRAVGECAYSTGTIFSWELNVPSGKIVVANDLRGKFKITEDHYVNNTDGVIATSLDYASVGMSHGFVGNSCPGVHKKNEREFIIGNRPEIEVEDEDDKEYLRKNSSGLEPEYEGTTQVASICTDLWWYSIVDYDQYVQRYGEPTEEDSVEVVECEPGVYEFLHVGRDIDTEKYPSIYTYFYKVREPDPVVDYRKDYDELNLTAEQCLHNILKDYYMGSDKFYDALSTMMCCYGTGAKFHSNGFFYSSYNKNLTNSEPEIVIPDKLENYEWYPIAEEYSPVCLIAQGKVKANESFIRLSFNVLHSIMNTPVDAVKNRYHTQYSVDLAKEMVNELYKREPNLAPDYVKEIM